MTTTEHHTAGHERDDDPVQRLRRIRLTYRDVEGYGPSQRAFAVDAQRIEGRNRGPERSALDPVRSHGQATESLNPCQRAVSAYSTTMLSATIRMFQSGYAWG
jgi:hypothetical protein